MKIVVLILVLTWSVEVTALIAILTKHYFVKNVIYHVFNIVQLILVTNFFLEINKPGHHKILRRINYVIWPVLGTGNVVLFQPINGLNTNTLMLESFAVISMSLWTIYVALKQSDTTNIFNNLFFWVSFLLLIEWSSTFFFWAFVKLLNRNDWPYMKTATNACNVINIITYTGIGIILLLSRKKTSIENI